MSRLTFFIMLLAIYSSFINVAHSLIMSPVINKCHSLFINVAVFCILVQTVPHIHVHFFVHVHVHTMYICSTFSTKSTEMQLTYIHVHVCTCTYQQAYTRSIFFIFQFLQQALPSTLAHLREGINTAGTQELTVAQASSAATPSTYPHL